MINTLLVQAQAFVNQYTTEVTVTVLALCALLLVLWLRKPDPYPYHAREALLTGSEQKYYRALVSAVGDEATVFAKPRIADILGVDRMTDKSHWQRCFNKIAQKHVDFVLCDNEDQSFIMAIELNDRSHQQEHRIQRDIFVTNAFARAQIPLLMTPTKSKYSAKGIRSEIQQILNLR